MDIKGGDCIMNLKRLLPLILGVIVFSLLLPACSNQDVQDQVENVTDAVNKKVLGQDAEPSASEKKQTSEESNSEQKNFSEKTELVYDIKKIKDSVTQYSYEENPYYLEGLEGSIQMFNEFYATMNTDQNAELLSLEDVLKDIGMSKSMRKKILSIEGENVLENEDFWRMDEKEDKSFLFSKGNYFEVSSKAKDDVDGWTALSTMFYFGDLKDNKPDGEGVLFSIGDTGMRILCAGDFKEGRMNGKGVLFSKDSLGSVIAEQGNYENNQKGGTCTSYNNSDMLQIYKLYRDNWNEYKEQYYESYSKDVKNKVVSNFFKKDVIAKLMYMSACYEAKDIDSLFIVRVNYPVIKPGISYSGEYKEGDYSGKGTLYGNCGTLWYQGEFKKGMYHGEGTIYYALTGIVQYDGEFREGKMDGEGSLYNTDGSLRKKGSFDNELIDKENEMAETMGLYGKLYEKYEQVGLQKFFEKDNLVQDDGSKKKTNKEDNTDVDTVDTDEYICPDSDVKKLSIKDVKKLSKADRRRAKNEIYARYGRKFNDISLQEYFNGKSWYTGTIEPEDFDESVFNKVEKYNIKLLAKYE